MGRSLWHAEVLPLAARGTHFPHFGVAHGDDFDAEGLEGLLPLRHVGLHCLRSAGAAGSGVLKHPASPSLRPPRPMTEPLRSSPPWLRGSPSPPLPGRGRTRAVGKRRAAEGEQSLAMTARRDVIAGPGRTESWGPAGPVGSGRRRLGFLFLAPGLAEIEWLSGEVFEI